MPTITREKHLCTATPTAAILLDARPDSTNRAQKQPACGVALPRCRLSSEKIVQTAVSYTHLDVYKRQAQLKDRIEVVSVPGSVVSEVAMDQRAGFDARINGGGAGLKQVAVHDPRITVQDALLSDSKIYLPKGYAAFASWVVFRLFKYSGRKFIFYPYPFIQ